MKYGIIEYNRKGVINIGDDIQLLAIRRIYKKIGISENELIKIDFYDLVTYAGEEVILPVCFPLFGYNEMNGCVTCFSTQIHPVFLSLSLLDVSLGKKDVEYLRKYEPIGCRDEHTYNGLRKLGIQAYLNGCITVTLEKRKGEGDFIYCIDVYDDVINRIPIYLKNKVMLRSHLFYSLKGDTIEYAEKLLKEYCSNAKLVITSRLHCAVPCLAMGIPVILVQEKFRYTFSWLERLIPLYTPDQYDVIDWEPSVCNMESLKYNMERLAIKRLRGEKDISDEVEWIEDFYSQRIKREYVIDSLECFKEWLSMNWEPQGRYSYVIWGVVQHAAVLIDYIKRNYPFADLTDVVDTYKRMQFLGHETKKIDEVPNIQDKYIFVCASAAASPAKEYLLNNNVNEKKYCIWYTKGMQV